MAATQAQLDALEAAKYSGTAEVSLPDGSKIRYRSMAELDQAILDAKADLGLVTHVNVIYPTHYRGFHE